MSKKSKKKRSKAKKNHAAKKKNPNRATVSANKSAPIKENVSETSTEKETVLTSNTTGETASAAALGFVRPAEEKHEKVKEKRVKKVREKKERRIPGFVSPVLCFLSLVVLDVLFRTIYQDVGNTAVFNGPTMVFTIAWSLLITVLLSLLPKLPRRILMMIAGLFFSILAIVHGAMQKIFGNFFSFSDMNFAGDGARFFSWDYLTMNPALLGTVILSLLLMILACITARPLIKGKKRPYIWPVIACVLITGSVFAIRTEHRNMLPDDDHMSWDKIYDAEKNGEVYWTFTDSNRCLPMTGLYQYTFRNARVSMGTDTDGIDVAELTSYYAKRKTVISGDNEMTGVMEGKNLIMVMMESMDSWMISEETTPNLYKLQQNSVNLENFYTPLFLNAATFNTEILSQTGLIPANNAMNSGGYSTHAFPLSMANQFRDCGYTVNSFHSASAKIYSRGSIHENLGFETYNNCYAMNMDDYMMDSQMIGGFDKMVSTDPFYSFIITYSGHGPYSEEMSNISDPHIEKAKSVVRKRNMEGSDKNLEEYTYALAHAMEADLFVGELMDRLKKEDLLDDTLVVFYADHYGKYMTDRDFLRQIKEVEGEPANLYRTPCIMTGAGLEKQTIKKYCSSLDLLPTINNMFRLPADRAYYVGDDIFGEDGGVVILPNNKWFDGKTYYSSSYKGEMTDEMRQTCQMVSEKSQISMDTLRSNYFNSKTYKESDDAKSNSYYLKQKTGEKALFQDVEEDDVSAVNFCVKRKYLEGGTETKFYPEMNVTRGSVIRALWIMAGRPEPKKEVTFIDMPEDEEKALAIQWATSNHLVSGYKSGKFKPAEPITRQQMASMLYGYAKFSGYNLKVRGSLGNYSDAKELTHYAVKPMKWALGNHLITGRKDKLEPLENVTRGEFAHILQAMEEYVRNQED